MLAIQTGDGVRLTPLEEVASLTPVRPGRTRVVLGDGTVGHLPGPPPDGPWVLLGESRVRPEWLARDGDQWRDPADYRYPYQPLDEPEDDEEEPELALGVQSLHREKRQVFWRTDAGDEACPTRYRPTLAAYPELLDLGTGVSVNPRRVRQLIPGMKCTYLELDNGTRLLVQNNRRLAVRQAFGCDTFEAVDASLPKVLHWLRDLPYDPALAPVERVRRDFSTARHLALAVVWRAVLQQQPFPGDLAEFYQQRVLPLLERMEYTLSRAEFIGEIFSLYTLDLIWQGLFYALQGTDKEYGRDHQGYFYMPVSSPLSRIGFMRLNDPLDKAKAEELFQRILAEMVGDHRLFTFAQLGFEDTGEARREIGSAHPRIVLVVEKKDLTKRARILAHRYGISLLVTGGVPNLVEVEFFLRALGGSGPLILLAYVDWDPSGYWVATTMVKHCLRYGVACAAPPQFLVRPEHFSAEELELYSRGLDTEDSRVINWVKATNGIAGQARGVYAEWLRPFARVEAVMDEAMRALGVTQQLSC